MQAVHQHLLHANIAANAVYVVHHVIARLDVRKVLQLSALVLAFKAVPALQTVDIVFRQQQPRLRPQAEPAE